MHPLAVTEDGIPIHLEVVELIDGDDVHASREDRIKHFLGLTEDIPGVSSPQPLFEDEESAGAYADYLWATTGKNSKMKRAWLEDAFNRVFKMYL